MTKEKIMETVEQLPGDFQLEDLIERLLFIQYVEERVALSEHEGHRLTFEEAKRRLSAAPHAA